MSIVTYTGPSSPQEIRKYLLRKTKDEIVWEYLRQWRGFGEALKEQETLQKEMEDVMANAQWLADIVRAHLPHLPEAREALDASPGVSAARMKAERNALAAHVERLADLVQASINGIEWYRDRFSDDFGEADEEHLTSCRRALEELEETPATSLARLKAQWQAEAAKEHFLYGYGFCRMNGFLFDEHLQKAAEEYVKRLHRQAEEARRDDD